MSDTGRVILVDDDPTLLKATAAVLRHHGFEVDCHASAASALSALERGGFDLVVTDLHMPEHSGLELLRRASELGGGTTAIVITGQPDVGSAIDALRAAAVDYIVKPFDPRDLVDRVRAGVAKARARARVSEAKRRAEDVGQMLDALRMALDAPGALVPASASGSSRPPRSNLRGLKREEREALSVRELEVVELMVGGKSPKEIAQILFISTHTVRNHLRSIYAKLGVHTQVELVRKVVG